MGEDVERLKQRIPLLEFLGSCPKSYKLRASLSLMLSEATTKRGFPPLSRYSLGMFAKSLPIPSIN
jgi:hypothetical protein